MNKRTEELRVGLVKLGLDGIVIMQILKLLRDSGCVFKVEKEV